MKIYVFFLKLIIHIKFEANQNKWIIRKMSIVWKNNNQKRLSDIEIRKLLKNIKEIFCKRLIQYFNKKNKTVYITYFSLSHGFRSLVTKESV